MTTRQCALILFLAAAPACAQVDYRPPFDVLYGHGQGGDGLGYGYRRAYISQHDFKVYATPQLDTEPWGRYDNSVPGYRSHGQELSHPFYGKTPLEQRVYHVGRKPYRGRHDATQYFDRHGRPAYTYEF